MVMIAAIIQSVYEKRRTRQRNRMPDIKPQVKARSRRSSSRQHHSPQTPKPRKTTKEPLNQPYLFPLHLSLASPTLPSTPPAVLPLNHLSPHGVQSAATTQALRLSLAASCMVAFFHLSAYVIFVVEIASRVVDQ